MQAEQLDIMVTWGHLYISLDQPAIPPPGECVPNVELFRRLAKTMEFDDDYYWDRTDEQMLIDFHDWNAPATQGITWDKLVEHGYMRINVGTPDTRAPHAKGNFPAPSGKCEFKSSLAEGGNFVIPVWRSIYDAMQPGEPIDPLPDYVPPFESPDTNPELAKRYPLNIVSSEAARIPQQPVRQRIRQAARAGRATHLPAPRRCSRARHRRGGPGAGMQ